MAIGVGSIAFFNYFSEGLTTDGFSFMVLEEIAAGEVVHFTDNGVQNDNSFLTGEDTTTWTNNTGVPVTPGTIITFTSGTGFDVGGTSGATSLSLITSGDQVVAYQGTEASPTYIAMIHMNGDYDASPSGSTNSALPSTLTDGVNAISIAPEIDNAAYTGPITPTDPAGWRARLNDEINWTGNNDAAVASTLDGTSPTVTCFLSGSMIATPQGDARVEDLQIGDLIMSAAGKALPVKWVGRQTVQKQRHSLRMQPVRICAGALGDGLPHADLTVTADHGMVIDGYVINASALVNHDTIDFVPMSELEQSFIVYRIETENHDVILANGTPSETFVDAVGRAVFDNYQEYLDLYGVERIVPEMNRPRISAQRLLPAKLRNRLGLSNTVSFVDPAFTA